jgi:hypothetical protein
MSRMRACSIDHFANVEEFWTTYPNGPDFPHDSSFDQFEKFKLFQFTNYMKIIVYLLNKAEGHRDHAIELAVRITEGRHARYTFGSGSPKRGLASPSLRRKSIYWQEGGVIPKKSERHRKRTVYEFVYDDIGLNSDEKSSQMLDSLFAPSADKHTSKRRNFLFPIQSSAVFGGEEYVIVWENTSNRGDYITRVTTAIRRNLNPDGSMVEQLLGRSVFVCFPVELGQDEMTGPFCDELDYRDVIEEVTENAVEFLRVRSEVTGLESEIFIGNNVKVKVTETFSPVGTEVRHIALSSWKAVGNDLERSHVESILADGSVNLSTMDSMIEDRGGAAANLASIYGTTLNPKAARTSVPTTPGQLGSAAGFRRLADGSIVADSSVGTPQGFRLLSTPPQPHMCSNIIFSKEQFLAPPVNQDDYNAIIAQNQA